jgi:hypothetical protein
MVYAVLGLHILCWCWCPEIGTSSMDWAQLRGFFYLKTETDSSLRNIVFLNKNRMMDNILKHNNCIVLNIFNLYAFK